MKNKFKTIAVNILLPVLVAVFNILLVIYPTEVIDSSRQGVVLWFNNVFPSLLPFLIGTNILISLGVVSFIGTILEPIMYPLFGVPGIGGFALICGMTSGYPMGAKITSELREKNLITKIEAQRLIAFTNNSGPLFIVGTVGVSMFSNSNIGYFILISHYLGAIVSGLLFKYYKFENQRNIYSKKDLLYKAYRNMIRTRKSEKLSLPAILGQSIKNSMETILIIGGYITLFSVLARIFELINFVSYIDNFIIKLTGIRINNNFLKGILFGIIEVTNGAKVLADSGNDFLFVMGALFIISFGGFCIHFQAINFLNKTDISIPKYIVSKFIHAIISVVLGLFLYPFFNFNKTQNVFLNIENNFISRLVFSSWSFIFSFCVILILFLIINIYFILKKKNKIYRLK